MNVHPLRPEAQAPHRNPGMAFEPDWIDAIHINLSAAERRVDQLGGRRSWKKAHQAAWLLRGISCIDLTTLAGDDTPGRVRRLCAKARNPVRQDILEALGVEHLGITTGAVCVYHEMVETAVRALEGTDIPVEVLMKSAPAIIAAIEAWATLRIEPSSPVARIAFIWASPQASRKAFTSS